MAAKVLSAVEVAVPTLDPVPAAVEISLIFSVSITIFAIVDTCVETAVLSPTNDAVNVLRPVEFVAASAAVVEIRVLIPGSDAVARKRLVMLLVFVETTLLTP